MGGEVGEEVRTRETGVREARVTVAVSSESGSGSESAWVQKSGSDVEDRVAAVIDLERPSGSGMP